MLNDNPRTGGPPGKFLRRLPDHLAITMAQTLIELGATGSTGFPALFEATFAKMKERNLVAGGEEMLRLRAFEKLQHMADQQLVTKIGKEYMPTHQLREAYPPELLPDTIVVQNKSLSFSGSTREALDLVNELHAAYAEAGRDMHKTLHDWVFAIGVALQHAGLLDEDFKEVTAPEARVYYPYNETFKLYGEPRAGKRAQEFIDSHNKLKGGTWVLHTQEQFDAWYKSCGSHIAHLKFKEY